MSYQLQFSNSSGSIGVQYTATLKDPENLSEQFFVGRAQNMTTYLEQSLFYFWTTGIPWTLNEINFFCTCNNLCLQIYDSEGVFITSYGLCGQQNKIFTEEFDNTFA